MGNTIGSLQSLPGKSRKFGEASCIGVSRLPGDL